MNLKANRDDLVVQEDDKYVTEWQKVFRNPEKKLELSEADFLKSYDKSCVRLHANFAGPYSHYLFDSTYHSQKQARDELNSKRVERLPEKKFSTDELSFVSPKMLQLMLKIRDLDKEDMKNHGTKFKHFIYTDVISSVHGAKMIASCLLKGLHLELVFNTKPKYSENWTPPKAGETNDVTEETNDDVEMTDGDDTTVGGGNVNGGATENPYFHKISLKTNAELLKTSGNNVAVMTTLQMFKDTYPVAMRKKVISLFNSRKETINEVAYNESDTSDDRMFKEKFYNQRAQENNELDNVHGQLVRFMVMDGGFKEGVDLYDVKYVHLFECPQNIAFKKQIVGRALRLCGQKGLPFEKDKGWTVHVFEYDTIIPDSLKFKFNMESTTNSLYKSIEEEGVEITEELMEQIEDACREASVDANLNRNIHLGRTSAPPTKIGGGPLYNSRDEGSISPEQLEEIRSTVYPSGDFKALQQKIDEVFSHSRYKWPVPEMKDGCNNNSPTAEQEEKDFNEEEMHDNNEEKDDNNEEKHDNNEEKHDNNND